MSYIPETLRTAGSAVDAAIWNQAVRANQIAIAGGGGYPCQGRLTLETGVPVSTAGQSAKATVYYTPTAANGTGMGAGSIYLYDEAGEYWAPHTFEEISASASALAANTPADAFVYDDSGLKLEFVNWTNGTTRATELDTQDNVYVKTGAHGRRYVGSVCGTANGAATSDGTQTRLVWNYHNRAVRPFRNPHTADVTYSQTAYGEFTSSYQCSFVIGLAEEPVYVWSPIDAGSGATYYGTVTVGLDGTTPASGANHLHIPISSREQGIVSGIIYPGIGYHYTTILGRENNSSGTITLYYRVDATASPSTFNGGWFYG